MRTAQPSPPQTDAPSAVRTFIPAFGRLVNVTTEPRAATDELATIQTLGHMASLARLDSTNPIVRRAALLATQKAGTPRKKAEAVWAWIHRNVRTVPDAQLAQGLTADPENAELLIRPADVLTMTDPQGDCDDQAGLAAAMLRALGIEVFFRAVKCDPRYPNQFSHVYAVARVDGGELAIDTLDQVPVPGWEVSYIAALDFPLEDQEPMKQPNLGAIDWNEILQTGMDTTSKILTTRLATPQLAPGQYIQNTGGVMYQQPANASALSFPGINVGGDSSSWLIIGAVVLVVLFLIVSAKR